MRLAAGAARRCPRSSRSARRRDERRQRVERRRLARAGAAADEDVQPRARPPRARKSRSGGVHVPQRDELVGAEAARGGSGGSSAPARRAPAAGCTTFTREPSGRRASHSGSASSTRRPSGARIRSIAWRSSASEANAHVGRLEAPAALDPHRPGAVDHDLVDVGVAQQRLERPEPERALGHARDELVARRPRRAAPPRGRRAPRIRAVQVAAVRRPPRRPAARAARRRGRPGRRRGHAGP